MKELLDAQKASEEEIAKKMAQVPTRLEIIAIVANIAEKYGFEVDVTDGLPSRITPEDFTAQVYLHSKIADVLELRNLEVEFRISSTKTFKNVEDALKSAEEIKQAARLVEELQSRELLYRRENANDSASGIILNSGDENLIAKYVKILKAEIDYCTERVNEHKNKISDYQLELNDLTGSNRKSVKERAKTLQSEIALREGFIKNYQNSISRYQNELAEIEDMKNKNLNMDASAA